MAKKNYGLAKFQLGRQGNPAPPVGPALGQHGVNIMAFAGIQRTAAADWIYRSSRNNCLCRSFLYLYYKNPRQRCVEKGLGLEKASGEPNWSR